MSTHLVQVHTFNHILYNSWGVHMKSSQFTKENILSAAVDLFAEDGYRAVSMRDIAKRCGIKPASIYNHYASKEQILDILLDQYLDRMELFYKRLNETKLNISAGKGLAELLEQLILTYEPDEMVLMYKLTRIVHHEQFHSFKAADALIGNGYRRYMEEHVRFFDRLSDAGLITGKERNKNYGELFARISLTFATQFLHPEVEGTIKNQAELYHALIPLVVNYEQSIAGR